MGRRVLIVEDHESMALALDHLVRSLGCDVIRASSADAARERIHGAAPDLVIVAAELGGGSGYDIARAIRSEPGLAGVKTLVLSARCGRLGVEKAFALGADAFLPKPFTISDLKATVRALLGHDEGRAERGTGHV